MFYRYDHFPVHFLAHVKFVITIIRRLLYSCTGSLLYVRCKPRLSHVSVRCV